LGILFGALRSDWVNEPKSPVQEQILITKPQKKVIIVGSTVATDADIALHRIPGSQMSASSGYAWAVLRAGHFTKLLKEKARGPVPRALRAKV